MDSEKTDGDWWLSYVLIDALDGEERIGGLKEFVLLYCKSIPKSIATATVEMFVMHVTDGRDSILMYSEEGTCKRA